MNLTYQTLAFSPVRKLELWRYFTYAFLHVGTTHLLINIILQLVISFPLESEVGSRNVLFVYIGGILSGSLAASLSPDFTLMVGASSGIYSLLMSHISHICLVSMKCEEVPQKLFFFSSELQIDLPPNLSNHIRRCPSAERHNSCDHPLSREPRTSDRYRQSHCWGFGWNSARIYFLRKST